MLDDAWKNISDKTKSNPESKHKSGFLYLLALVLCDSLTRGSNSGLRQRLEHIRDDSKILKKYAHNP